MLIKLQLPNIMDLRVQGDDLEQIYGKGEEKVAGVGPLQYTRSQSSISRTSQEEIRPVISASGDVQLDQDGSVLQNALNHRRLNPRQIQLTAIAGSIGA